jgi:hypothetical protein
LGGARKGYEGLGGACRSLKFTKVHKKNSVFAENFLVLAESVSVFAENDSSVMLEGARWG